MIQPPDLTGVAGVVGVGIDVVDLNRFRRTVARTPGVVERCFSERERVEASERPDRDATLAGRFAVKEAVLKVLGAGIFDLPLAHIELRGAPGRPPRIEPGPALASAAAAAGITGWHVSITHSELIAAAVVVGTRRG